MALDHHDISSNDLTFQRKTYLLYCGFVSGLLQAGLFNPWDRALYLSVINSRPFLHIKNFENPWSGVFQTIGQRAISAGMYFPLEEIFRHHLYLNTKSDPHLRPYFTFLAGTIAGTINGLVMNPISAVKYHYWGQTALRSENAITTAVEMYKKGGLILFFVGSTATITRDIIFGGTFALMRHELRLTSPNSTSHTKSKTKVYPFILDLISASTATLLSSPFNYVRNMHYATPLNEKPLSIKNHLFKLIKEAKLQKTTFAKVKFLQQRLRIGWGTARVGCGMAFGSYVYSTLTGNF
eukprot:gene17486-23039_t